MKITILIGGRPTDFEGTGEEILINATKAIRAHVDATKPADISEIELDILIGGAVNDLKAHIEMRKLIAHHIAWAKKELDEKGKSPK